MKNTTLKILTVFAALLLTVTVRADDKTGHRFIAHSNGRVVILNAKGETEWEVAMPSTSHDIQVMPNGNMLIQNSITTIVEMTPNKEIVWKHESKPTTSNARIDRNHHHVLVWGGLRGALALGLALGLAHSMPQRATITTVAFGEVAFTVIVQDLTITSKMRRLPLLISDAGSSGMEQS